eukprot:15435736-Alexandrium_andersonii.AAC.1
MLPRATLRTRRLGSRWWLARTLDAALQVAPSPRMAASSTARSAVLSRKCARGLRCVGRRTRC